MSSSSCQNCTYTVEISHHSIAEKINLGQAARGVVAARQYNYYMVYVVDKADVTFDLTQFGGDPDLFINCNSSGAALPSFGHAQVRTGQSTAPRLPLGRFPHSARFFGCLSPYCLWRCSGH